MHVTITDVAKRYGDVVALDGASFEIPSGSTFGILGTNGAGKTTLFELLVGHDSPDRGRIEVGGLDVGSAGHRVRERVGFLPEHTGFPGNLTGREVLSITARIRGVTNRSERIEACLDLVGLSSAMDRRVEGYSNGMGRRLGLAAALLSRPPVLVLDEPTAGLDPRGVRTFHEIVERIDRETDATVVLSSHVLSEVERLCDAVAILHEGRLRAVGPIDELRETVPERSTVTLHPAGADEETRAEHRARLRDAVTGVGNVRTGPNAIEVICDREGALTTLSRIAPDDVDRFEVVEPGLDAVFHEALTDGETVGEQQNGTQPNDEARSEEVHS